MAKRRKNKEQEETLVDLVEVKNQTQSFIEKNQLLIIGVAAALILLIAAFLAYKYLYQAPRNAEAMEQLYRAELQFNKDSFALALENPGVDALGFLDIIDEYGGTKAANIASYYSGISYLNLGRYESAIEYLSHFDATGEITPIMKFGAMGDAYSELNDMDKAMSMYKKAAGSRDNNFLVPYYLQKLGMMYLSQGDSDQALKTFEKIKNEYPQSNEGLTADKYIARLN